MKDEKDATATAEVEAGEDQDQQDANALETAEKPAAATDAEKSGEQEQTEEEKASAAEAKAAEEAAARERAIREKTPGTVEYLEKRVAKEKDARKKLGITLSKSEERAIRAETRAEVLEEMIAKLGQKPDTTAKGPTEKADADGEPELNLPDMADFTDDKEWKAATAKAIKDFNKAFVQHEVSRGTRERETKTEQEKAVAEINKRVDSILAAGQKDYEDFDEVTHKDNLTLSPAMMSGIINLDSADAHHVEYHLGKNKAENDRIMALSPARQVMEIGRLSDKLRGARATKPKETNAPPPIKPLKGGTTPLPKTIAEAKTSEERFAIWEREQKEAQRS